MNPALVAAGRVRELVRAPVEITIGPGIAVWLRSYRGPSPPAAVAHAARDCGASPFTAIDRQGSTQLRSRCESSVRWSNDCPTPDGWAADWFSTPKPAPARTESNGSGTLWVTSMTESMNPPAPQYRL